MTPVRQMTGFGAQHYYPPPIAWTRFALWVSMTFYSFGMVAVFGLLAQRHWIEGLSDC